MTSPSIGFQNGVLSSRFESPFAHRLGISLSAGVFSVTNANGVALSNINPGFVGIPSATTRGLVNSYMITANQSFNDSSSGGSNIIGNLFGTTSGDTWGNDVPFYLYACIDDANSAPIFGISRVPNLVQAPATANIGTPASATADVSYGMFLFSSVTIANYDLNPVVCLGSFRMRKNSSNDWAVQALSTSDGFGLFQSDQIFTMPGGVNGNAASKYFIDNGGTAPGFAANFSTYKMSKEGMLWYNGLFFNNVAGVSGAGAVTLTHNTVIELASTFGQIGYPCYGGYQNTAGNPFFSMGPILAQTNINFRLVNGTTTLLLNSNFPNTVGYAIYWNYNAPVRTV